MTREVTGNTGVSMTVELDVGSRISSYTVRRADRTSLGTADFVVVSDVREERIFFCTEVYQDVGSGSARRREAGHVRRAGAAQGPAA